MAYPSRTMIFGGAGLLTIEVKVVHRETNDSSECLSGRSNKDIRNSLDKAISVREDSLPRMKLIFIYGPPAVGKLSVATELAKLTAFRLFHNHVSIQFVKSIFDFGTKPFWILTDKFRREMF